MATYFTFDYALSVLTSSGSRPSRERKKLENNTYLVRVTSPSTGEVRLVVRLHQTDVVTLHQDNTYTLTSGGWKTVTTKDRINKYSPVRISQVDHEWYVSRDGKTGEGILFTDGMTVDSSGRPLTGGIQVPPRKPRVPKYKTRTWEIWVYDVLGNSRDGYEVNDRFNTGTEVTIRCRRETFNEGTEREFHSHEPTDLQLACATGWKGCNWEWSDGGTFYVTRRRSGFPVGELVEVKPEEDNPKWEEALRQQQEEYLTNGVMVASSGPCDSE